MRLIVKDKDPSAASLCQRVDHVGGAAAFVVGIGKAERGVGVRQSLIELA